MGVNIKKSGTTLSINLDHPIVDKIDSELISGCLEAILDCCATSGCCDGRIAINETCLATIAKHNDATGCISKCFGCA